MDVCLATSASGRPSRASRRVVAAMAASRWRWSRRHFAARQHYNGFSTRFTASRSHRRLFAAGASQGEKETREALARYDDIVVGTHALLSKSTTFKTSAW